MLIAGAKGHAKEVLELVPTIKWKNLVFFDDVSIETHSLMFEKFRIIRSLDNVVQHFIKSPEFILGLGGSIARSIIAKKLMVSGGKMISIIAANASIGSFNVTIEPGVNIMNGVMISNDTFIGEGALINARAMIHHDSLIGNYCEIGPGCIVAGGCKIGENTVLGVGSVILPNIKIGRNVVIGAGAVVRIDVPDDSTMVGVPAKPIKK